jgi:GNAT superfamily N-acetyltransferase
MKNTLNALPIQGAIADPIQIKVAESWQWEILAKAFLHDPVLNFWLGEKTDELMLQNFFEAVIKDTLSSGGAVFCSPDRKVVLVWTRHEYSLEPPTQWKQRWYEILGSQGVERYYWLYEAGDVYLDTDQRRVSMLPDYIGVTDDAQGKGYASHILKWTLEHYDKLGFQIPFLLASTRRSAKLYAPLMGFHVHREVLLSDDDDAPAAVFMKRNNPD